MPRKFYTERDIEDLVNNGKTTLEITNEVVLTDLAYEKAERLGLTLVQGHLLPPAAPVRPYLSQPQGSSSVPCPSCSDRGSSDEQLKQRIRDAVNAKLGNQVDPALLETIITRVLNNVGVK